MKLEANGQWHAIAPDVVITCDDEYRQIASTIREFIEQRTGKLPVVQRRDAGEPSGRIHITSRGANDLGVEGYALSVRRGHVELRARTVHGAFNGWQTLRQLIEQGELVEGESIQSLRVPECEIVDKPRYAWRGMHLDVSRHFFPVEFIKRYIDLLAYHKFNVFHWHLTDDQGWRIEIRKYPSLTAVGAWRDEFSGRYGGYYTQEEIRDVVQYAAERFVTIVPEIEMPGHALAALASYPAISCKGGPFDVPTTWGVFDDVYCAGNDETFVFIDNVLAEVCALFPGEYIHIGGDECPKSRWKDCEKCQARITKEKLSDESALQSWFMHRIEAMLAARGKRMIGWDEILEGGLAPKASVMSWRGMEGGIAAANEGHDVVMSPTSHCYFDYRQSHLPGERGPIWSPVLNTERVYGFEPMPESLKASRRKHILGAQGNVWTEWLKAPADVEYMA
ncbi:MAG: beta-N-acetylhexosaminidase, partial [Phycisphaerales bacterium]|nr:beta-N-acetylhexosaminidase [Phycisphaerales bacterium]